MLSSPRLFSVVTTVNAPSAAVRRLCQALRPEQGHLLVIGDKKGPVGYPLPGAELISLERQLSLPLRLAKLLPVNHYTRKNLGYLVAISRRANCIYETDDDNRPAAGWHVRSSSVQAKAVDGPTWCNVYRYFTKELIWPRGLPLDQIAGWDRRLPKGSAARSIHSPIQQGLVNESADVDAIWRLVLDKPFRFEPGVSRALMRGVWCPFNSQNTWWWPEAYPLMYLPSGCTFRMTDIWRSLVAQRCVWELGGAVTFHAADAAQDRNAHRLMKDFADEVPGYLHNERIREILTVADLRPGPDAAADNLLRCYEALVKEKIFPSRELRQLEAWLRDLEKVARLTIS